MAPLPFFCGCLLFDIIFLQTKTQGRDNGASAVILSILKIFVNNHYLLSIHKS